MQATVLQSHTDRTVAEQLILAEEVWDHLLERGMLCECVFKWVGTSVI